MLKKIAVAVVAAAGLMVATVPAHAAGHVSLSLGVGLPVGGVYAAPQPTYYGPPAVAYSAPVYAAPYPYAYPAYYGPRYYGPRYYGPRYYGGARVAIGFGGGYRGGWHGGGHWHR